MSDESSRSARPSGQRRNDGAPAWWPALERVDLPDDDEGVPAAHRRWYEEKTPAAPETPLPPSRAAHRPRPAWVVNTLVGLAVALVLMVAIGVADSDYQNQLLTVTMLVGVPLILVVITTLVVARRSR
ncbi:MAG: hypothetical protein WCB51_04395 [Candidatus Dormiibacterota bacterium]